MIDILFQGVPTPTGQPARLDMVIQGHANELANLAAALTKSLHNGPTAFDGQATNGTPYRIIIDCLGEPVPMQ